MGHSFDVLDRLSLVVPPRLVELAEARSVSDQPVQPARSASVILLRDRTGGLETYLLQRHARMPFAASMVVFPGGRLDPADDPPDGSGPGGAGVDPIRRCALRETEEETGVQLAIDALHPWAHWITPVIETRRYDTYFFLAALPAGQEAADLSGETDAAAWWSPSAALAAERAGSIGLMPPTLSILLELADHATVAHVLAAAAGRIVDCVLPGLVPTPDGWRFRYPSPEGGLT